MKNPTLEQKHRKSLVDLRRAQLSTAQKNLMEARAGCDHFIIKVGYSSVCEICAKDFGWYCEDSPKKYCEYDESSGWIDCKHCGQPTTRK